MYFKSLVWFRFLTVNARTTQQPILKSTYEVWICGWVGLVKLELLHGTFFSLKLKQNKKHSKREKKLISSHPILFRKYYLQWRSHRAQEKWLNHILFQHLCLDCDVQRSEKISHIWTKMSILKNLERISEDGVGCEHHPTQGKDTLFHGLQLTIKSNGKIFRRERVVERTCLKKKL